jgi:hypothetical protein
MPGNNINGYSSFMSSDATDLSCAELKKYKRKLKTLKLKNT